MTFIKNSGESFMKKLSKGKLENRQCNYNDIPQYKFQMQKNTVYQIVWKPKVSYHIHQLHNDFIVR